VSAAFFFFFFFFVFGVVWIYRGEREKKKKKKRKCGWELFFFFFFLLIYVSVSIRGQQFLMLSFFFVGHSHFCKIILEPSIIGVGQFSNNIMGPLLFVYAAM